MKIYLAPMEGVVNARMRALLTSVGGLDRCVTEFVRVTTQLLPPRVFHRYCPELESGSQTPTGVPVYLQLLGSDPACLADNAARAEQLGAAGIDLNFGCPAKTVNKHRGGSVLLDEPELIHRIVSEIRRTLAPATPLTVKIRLGYADASPLLEVANAVTEAGASELIVHARTKAQGYKPPAHWEAIGNVRERVNIPLIANGEIWNREDYQRCKELSGCDDVMLGRGMLAHPALALTLKNAHQANMPWQQVLTHLIGFQQDLKTNCTPRHACSPTKQWLAYLQWHYREAEALLKAVKRIVDAEIMLAELQRRHLRDAA
ncbi:tRNA-dihydrouridine synthase C [Litorivivens lipolytica]|uniref:tRNA-dihydrouridine(16) synthase n=1 Tax=Litorivivens lipolytica TaxID=1524264 RepID=A0A7W4W3B2_9GAMM|nr:tRNA-dihydrouridine synthase [Litorivivens lipolytica]MBB3046686.1 tRNA-dihydrouridine synthase C [Litorivivens lipolytica]